MAGLSSGIYWADIIRDAFTEIGVLAAGETLSSDDQAFGLGKANRLLDNWNAERRAVYADVFNTYTLTANLGSHTIGPTGTFVVTKRPVTIDAARLIFTAPNPDIYQPITLRDKQWWQAQTIPGMTSAIPTDLYYDPTWPNGTLHFWPVPTVAYGVLLVTREYLAAVATGDQFSLPSGYREAVTLTLAEQLQIAYPRASGPNPVLAVSAAQARARIFANNAPSPNLVTCDAGMPTHGSSTFNYLTRGWD